LIEAPFEFVKAPRTAFQLGILFRAPGCIRGGPGTWHYSYGNNSVGI
jgi:hypothetical protein